MGKFKLATTILVNPADEEDEAFAFFKAVRRLKPCGNSKRQNFQ